jgi:hypothetical protein
MKKTRGRKSRETVSLSGATETSHLCNRIIKIPSLSRETIPLIRPNSFKWIRFLGLLTFSLDKVFLVVKNSV